MMRARRVAARGARLLAAATYWTRRRVSRPRPRVSRPRPSRPSLWVLGCEGEWMGSCVLGRTSGCLSAASLPRYTGLTTRQRQENIPSMRGAVKKGLALQEDSVHFQLCLLLTSWV